MTSAIFVLAVWVGVLSLVIDNLQNKLEILRRDLDDEVSLREAAEAEEAARQQTATIDVLTDPDLMESLRHADEQPDEEARSLADISGAAPEHTPTRALRDIVRLVDAHPIGGVGFYPQTDVIRYAKEVLADISGADKEPE